MNRKTKKLAAFALVLAGGAAAGLISGKAVSSRQKMPEDIAAFYGRVGNVVRELEHQGFRVKIPSERIKKAGLGEEINPREIIMIKDNNGKPFKSVQVTENGKTYWTDSLKLFLDAHKNALPEQTMERMNVLLEQYKQMRPKIWEYQKRAGRQRNLARAAGFGAGAAFSAIGTAAAARALRKRKEQRNMRGQRKR